MNSWQGKDTVRLLQPTTLLGVVDFKTLLILRVECNLAELERWQMLGHGDHSQAPY